MNNIDIQYQLNAESLIPDGNDIDAAIEITQRHFADETGVSEELLSMTNTQLGIVWEPNYIELDGQFYAGLTECKNERCLLRVVGKKLVEQSALVHELLHAYNWLFKKRDGHDELFCFHPAICVETKAELEFANYMHAKRESEKAQ